MSDFHRIVLLESPYAGNIERNLRYLRAGMRDALLRGEVPLASHALYTQPGVLRDDIPEERELGIKAGFFLAEVLQRRGCVLRQSGDHVFAVPVPTVRVFLEDFGISKGMAYGERHAEEIGQPIEHRSPCIWHDGTALAVNWKEEKRR